MGTDAPGTLRLNWPPIPRDFFDRDPTQVARELLGCVVVRTTDRYDADVDVDANANATSVVCGRVVEAEAYLAQGDSACHASRGKTRKNASMFGPAGTAYVYSIHARWCFNVVTEAEGTPSAVLIRALEPLAGIAVMEKRRATNRLLDLARGPARLCEALAIDRQLDGWDLARGERLWLTRDPAPERAVRRVLVSPRIGVTSAHDLPLRFYWADSPYVSGTRRANAAGRQA